MPRILADLPDEDIKWLDARAVEQGKSRAAILREAVASFRAEGSADWIERGFGLWQDRHDLEEAEGQSQRGGASSKRHRRDDYPDLFDMGQAPLEQAGKGRTRRGRTAS